MMQRETLGATSRENGKLAKIPLSIKDLMVLLNGNLNAIFTRDSTLMLG